MLGARREEPVSVSALKMHTLCKLEIDKHTQKNANVRTVVNNKC